MELIALVHDLARLCCALDAHDQASMSSKFSIMDNDTTLIIYPWAPEDAGIRRRVEHNIQFSFASTPCDQVVISL
jgi:hypothetical protein